MIDIIVRRAARILIDAIQKMDAVMNVELMIGL